MRRGTGPEGTRQPVPLSIMNSSAPVALIFRARLLPFSETFIRAQAEWMKHFSPFFVGIKKVPGLSLPKDSSWIANSIGLLGIPQELRFRAFGPGRDCLNRLRELKPQILHAHFGPDACEAIPLATALDVPFVATFHGFDITRSDAGHSRSSEGRRYLRQRHQLPEKVSLFIAVSDFIKDRLEQNGFPAERIRVHYIGVDIERFHPPAIEKRKDQVLFVGRLVEKKGCSFLIKAMSLVQESYPDIDLVIVGDGEQRRALELEARQSLRKYRFLGSQPPAVIEEWMHSALVFCVPSIAASDGDSEGFGMVFAEAQASGLPVVSFLSGGVPEAVAHGETGFLAPERDWRKLAEHIVDLLKSRELREQFGRAGRKRVEQKFDIRNQTASLERIYDELVGSHATQKKVVQ
jgi:colanic acid/amylovoran biosynthesis glycosyltransferase